MSKILTNHAYPKTAERLEKVLDGLYRNLGIELTDPRVAIIVAAFNKATTENGAEAVLAGAYELSIELYTLEAAIMVAWVRTAMEWPLAQTVDNLAIASNLAFNGTDWSPVKEPDEQPLHARNYYAVQAWLSAGGWADKIYDLLPQIEKDLGEFNDMVRYAHVHSLPIADNEIEAMACDIQRGRAELNSGLAHGVLKKFDKLILDALKSVVKAWFETFFAVQVNVRDFAQAHADFETALSQPEVGPLYKQLDTFKWLHGRIKPIEDESIRLRARRARDEEQRQSSMYAYVEPVLHGRSHKGNNGRGSSRSKGVPYQHGKHGVAWQ